MKKAMGDDHGSATSSTKELHRDLWEEKCRKGEIWDRAKEWLFSALNQRQGGKKGADGGGFS